MRHTEQCICQRLCFNASSFILLQLKICKAAEYMDSLRVKHVLQQPDQDTLIEPLTLIEQSVKMQNTAIKQHFAHHNHDIESIIGLIFEHCSKT